MDTTYNGWTEESGHMEYCFTIALSGYRMSKGFMLSRRLWKTIRNLLRPSMVLNKGHQDGVDYCDPTVNVHELNEMIWDL